MGERKRERYKREEVWRGEKEEGEKERIPRSAVESFPYRRSAITGTER
jgi:hypothetical protein